jgi:uncharacterized protein (DUF58 family)
MLSQEILTKIKHIEIYTRRILNNTLSGDSRSAVKGTGFEFDQIREYQLGDDVRYIDWKASMRMNTLLTKQYIEERSRSVILAVDCSGSTFFSSHDDLRFDTIARMASVLALVAEYGKDHVGLLMFSDGVETFIPPKRGRMHTRMIMEKLFHFSEQHQSKTSFDTFASSLNSGLSTQDDRKKRSRGTDLNVAFEYLARRNVNKALVFMISDFITDNPFTKYMNIVAKKHDLVAIRCLDERERKFPSVGFLPIQDSETGEISLIDTRGKHADRLNALLGARVAEQDNLFKQYGIDVLDVRIDQSFMSDLVCFFRRRMMY